MAQRQARTLRRRLGGSARCAVGVGFCGLRINDFLCSLVEIQAGSTEGCVCVFMCVYYLTQDMGVVWVVRDLFHATPLGDC